MDQYRGGGGGERIDIDAAFLRGRLSALPTVEEPGRRAHEKWLLESLRKRQSASDGGGGGSGDNARQLQ